MTTKRKETIEDLYCVPEDGKAELVNGELVIMEPTGFLPSCAAGNIYASLREHQRRVGSGTQSRTTLVSGSISPIANLSARTPPSIPANLQE